jgi:hypothetical protein
MIARPNRFAIDSLLEGAGFEPLVPATWTTRSRPSLSPGLHSRSCLRDQLVHRQGPTVRIRFPPPESRLSEGVPLGHPATGWTATKIMRLHAQTARLECLPGSPSAASPARSRNAGRFVAGRLWCRRRRYPRPPPTGRHLTDSQNCLPLARISWTALVIRGAGR